MARYRDLHEIKDDESGLLGYSCSTKTGTGKAL
jgi:hypothetical protein